MSLVERVTASKRLSWTPSKPKRGRFGEITVRLSSGLGLGKKSVQALSNAVRLLPSDPVSADLLRRAERGQYPRHEGLKHTFLAPHADCELFYHAAGECFLSCDGRNICVIDLAGNMVVQNPVEVTSRVTTILSGPGEYFAIVSTEEAKVFRLSSAKLLEEVARLDGRVQAFLSDSLLLTGQTTLKTHSLCSEYSGGPIFIGHEKQVLDCRALSRGKRLLTVSADRTCRLWNLENGECLKTVKAHRDFVCRLAVDSAEKVCATGDASGHVILWSLPKLEQKNRVIVAGSISNLSFLSSRFRGHIVVTYLVGHNRARTAICSRVNSEILFDAEGRALPWEGGLGILTQSGLSLRRGEDFLEIRQYGKEELYARGFSFTQGTGALLQSADGVCEHYLLPSYTLRIPAPVLVRASTLKEVRKARHIFTGYLQDAEKALAEQRFARAYQLAGQARLVEGYSRDLQILKIIAKAAHFLPRRKLREIWLEKELASLGEQTASPSKGGTRRTLGGNSSRDDAKGMESRKGGLRARLARTSGRRH